MFAATSLRQQVLSSAASSWVKGGTRRVLTVPAIDALAMIATAQRPSGKAALSSGAELLGAAEPVVSVIFPEAARIIVRRRQRHDEPPILEADFFRNPHLYRVTILARQYLADVGKGHDGCGCSARTVLAELGQYPPGWLVAHFRLTLGYDSVKACGDAQPALRAST